MVPQFSDGMVSYELVQNCFCDSETKRWHPIARVVWFIVKKKVNIGEVLQCPICLQCKILSFKREERMLSLLINNCLFCGV